MTTISTYIIVCILTVAIIKLFTNLAVKIGFTDKPNERKIHIGEIPPIGGMAMYFGYIVGIFIIFGLNDKYLPLITSLTILVLAGIYDDKYGLTPFKKIFWQIIASLSLTSWGGVYITQLGDLFGNGVIYLGNWAIPFTIVCLIGVMNAINMQDGMDGLAGSLILLSLISMIILALGSAETNSIIQIGLMATVVLGFLAFNMRFPWRKRAVIFMGDSGSMLVGFLITWYCIILTQTDKPAFTPITAVWIIGLPLLDMASVMLKRLYNKKGIFSADRYHLHHLLLSHGYTNSLTLVTILLLGIFINCIGLFGYIFRVNEYVMFYGFIVFLLIYYNYRILIIRQIIRKTSIHSNA